MSENNNKDNQRHGNGQAPSRSSANALPETTSDRIRYVVSGEIEVTTPLHIGTGAFEPLPDTGVRRNAEPPAMAVIVRDHEGAPYLPGTTLKGLLRRVAEAHLPAELTDALCGHIKSEVSGSMGALLVHGRPMKRPGSADGMPYAKELTERHVQAGYAMPGGAFVAARSTIDGPSGAAAHNRLFFQEMLAPGAVFPLHLTLDIRRRLGGRRTEARHGVEKACVTNPEETPEAFKARGNALLEALGTVLAALQSADWTMGKGQADGQGRVRLSGALTWKTLSLNHDGFGLRRLDKPPESVTRPVPPPSPAPAWTATIHLRCPGPFMILDSSHDPRAAERTRDERERGKGVGDPHDPELAQLKAQRRGLDRPLVPGTAVSGALRARAEWLAALARHRAAVEAGQAPPPRPEAPEPVLHPRDTARLTAVERLFGVTGFRGLLTLNLQEPPTATRWTQTSVKLDRFSGAPIDGALFSSAAFLGVSLTLTLTLESRRTRDEAGTEVTLTPTDDDLRLAKALVMDIGKNGLMLGHATNRGYGWFQPAQSEGQGR